MVPGLSALVLEHLTQLHDLRALPCNGLVGLAPLSAAANAGGTAAGITRCDRLCATRCGGGRLSVEQLGTAGAGKFGELVRPALGPVGPAAEGRILAQQLGDSGTVALRLVLRPAGRGDGGRRLVPRSLLPPPLQRLLVLPGPGSLGPEPLGQLRSVPLALLQRVLQSADCILPLAHGSIQFRLALAPLCSFTHAQVLQVARFRAFRRKLPLALL